MLMRYFTSKDINLNLILFEHFSAESKNLFLG